MKIIFTSLFALLCFCIPVMALEISPDEPGIVRLSDDAASVIVGNPLHASVTLENSRMLIVNAGQPGLTNMTVLNRNGQVVLSEKIIVNGPSHNYIRVKNACVNGGDSCQPTKMFYCKEGEVCHNVHVNEPTVSGNGGTSDASSGGGSAANVLLGDSGFGE